MGAYCYFILISEKILLDTRLSALIEAFSTHSIPLVVDQRSLLDQGVDKRVDDARIGDFGTLQDLTPFGRFGAARAGGSLDLRQVLYQAIAAFGDDHGALPFAWSVGDEDMKVQGLEEFLFNRFSEAEDGVSFPQHGMPEFLELPRDKVPAFIAGCKRILHGLKTEHQRGKPRPTRDVIRENILAMVTNIESRSRTNAWDLDLLNRYIQSFVNQTAGYDLNRSIEPSIIENVAIILEKHGIRLEIPRTLRDIIGSNRDMMAGATIRVRDVETIRAFCADVRGMLQRYPVITIRKDLLDYGTNMEAEEALGFAAMMGSNLRALETGMKRGFSDYLCILSH
ncbi:MAG: hypothetical protein JW839_00180 [Candidatus Lokiarchaeota archaeon]|nr:hypothetical protein [Candidatus Lokiarchaeota archaeon]